MDTLKTRCQLQVVSCIFGSRTFVPVSWMCKKQTSVSHNSTESEVISLDAGLSMNGLLALDLWDIVFEVLSNHTSHMAVLDSKNKTQLVTRKQKVDQLSEVDYVHTNTARQFRACLGPLLPLLVCSPAPCHPFFLGRVSSELCACDCSQPFHALGFGPGPCPVRSPSAVWSHSSPPLPPWEPLLRTMSRLSWRCLRNLWSRSLPRGLPLGSRTSGSARNPSLLPTAAPGCPRG